LLGGENVGPLVAVIACGVCLGFLPHNFHPARIFMGDCGALLLGLLMAASTMVVGGRTADQFSGQTYFFFAPMFIPLFVLGVPVVDTLFAIVRRTVRRSGVATADKEHLHHRLMRLGHGHRRSVVILWAWTAILSGLVLFPTFTNEGNAVIPFAVAALGVVLYTMFSAGRRRRGEPPVEVAEEVAPLPANVVALPERRQAGGGST
jgi:UDP-GlcNAc:undecaprenyl-phosphate GlcNAc-1-phosphate transferase